MSAPQDRADRTPRGDRGPHRWTPEEATLAGRKGGRAKRQPWKKAKRARRAQREIA